MRPLRLLLLLFCFIALPIFLTCISIFSAREAASDPLNTRYESRSSRLRTLFSFHAPSALFSPSAIISLTDDNSTFFLARPAAFGPLLSPKGMEGQLWVGRGFGDDTLGKNGEISIAGWEFGCSDVPGWGHENSKRSEQSIPLEKSQRAAATTPGRDSADPDMLGGQQKTSDAELDSTDDVSSEDLHVLPTEDDGTDDYLHHPLPDSNPAESGLPGEPAEKSKKKTHADIESLQESAEIAGKVVLLSRGGCGFLEKVKWAQRRGGIAVIVGDDERGAQLTTMYARGDTSNVTIPAIFTSFTSAHLLSSLVPPEVADRLTTEEVGPKLVGKDGFQNANAIAVGNGPTFTSKATSTLRPSILPATDSQHLLSRNRKGWVRNVLSKAGLRGESDSPGHPVEDSRRPPSSGNIDWVLLEDWNEEDQKQTLIKGQPVPTSSKTVLSITSTSKSSPARLHRPTGDDFVIGVQDWRDVDLVAPRPAHGMKDDNKQDKPGSPVKQISRSSSPPASNPAETGPLKGGSITPGSGEYDQQKAEGSRRPKSKGAGAGKDHQQKPNHQSMPAKSWFRFWKSGVSERTEVTAPERMPTNSHPQSPYHSAPKSTALRGNSPSQEDEHKGLWVTLTPTDVSTSPFFDTLLVLVVSPLVTLTIVYALLLLRSRIRRRRWRAPKSVVERLPVRTYHTMSTSSSTTSSQVASPDTSSPNSPLLRSTPRSISRNRPRSQTTTAVMTSSSTETKESPPTGSPKEKPTAKPMKRKRYTGRQVECVVCLEEYVDGESRVMSLPCGHEFHAECITPWLTTRRRTCPICKGDVVRSMARANAGHTEDQREEGEETSADIQDRVAETVNESPTASIPIPLRLEDVDDDSDIERGQDIDDTLNERNTAAPRSAWRNIVSGSVSALSGETVWRQSPRDRSR